MHTGISPPPTDANEQLRELTARVTVLLGQAQPLERRIGRDEAVPTKSVLTTIRTIQRAG
jgi:hypothetical protein